MMFYYSRALQRNEAKSNPAVKESLMTEMASNSLSIRDGKDKAKKLLDAFILQHPGSAETEKARALLNSI